MDFDRYTVYIDIHTYIFVYTYTHHIHINIHIYTYTYTQTSFANVNSALQVIRISVPSMVPPPAAKP